MNHAFRCWRRDLSSEMIWQEFPGLAQNRAVSEIPVNVIDPLFPRP